MICFQKSQIGAISKWSVFAGREKWKRFSFKTKTICFRPKFKIILFRRLYIEEKKENDLISLLCRLQVVGGLFILLPAALYIRVDSSIIILSQRIKIVKPISTNHEAELKKYNKWYTQLHIKCYSPSYI